METKILSAQEAFELSVPIRTRILSIEELMNAITERSLSGFNYLMIIGHISKETQTDMNIPFLDMMLFKYIGLAVNKNKTSINQPYII